MNDITKESTDECCGKKPVELTIEEQMAKEKKWSECTGDEIAWLGLDVDMDIKEIADWLEALALSGGCGFGSGDAFGDSSNSLATWVSSLAEKIRKVNSSCHVLSSPHKGKWENGTMYEYEYAYCSECGRMQMAGWDSHRQAEENIESFANDYKFCPGCGAEMEGGVYVY